MSAGEGLKPGDVFGRYHIERPLGSGGMASVYEALHVDLRKRVALKVLHAWLRLRLDVVQRFVLEARAASRLSHPHVVGISDIGAIAGAPFMAMDLLEGLELSAIVARDGPFVVERLADVMLPVLSAVAAAHDAGVLHRDLKPDNIFITRRRPHGEHPVLLDFGISKFDAGERAQPLTAAGELLGTPPYMAPEQVTSGMSFFDARSDQYALGVVLYECATGLLPFRDHASVSELLSEIARGGAPAPSSVARGIPGGFDALVARAMSLDPADRFPSVLDMGGALMPFASPRARALWADEFGRAPAPRPGFEPRTVTLSPADIRSVPLFAGIPEAELARLCASTPGLRLAAGAALFDQGARAASCFAVLSGEIQLSRTHGVDTWEIDTVGAGAVLGLAALWNEGTRPVSAVARSAGIAVELRRDALDRLGTDCPTLADRLYRESADLVVRRLRGARDRVGDLLDRPGADASREALVRLVAAIGEWSLRLPKRAR